MNIRSFVATLLSFCFVLASVRLGAAQPLVDFDFGATQAAWKNDGSALAVQDASGIAIRDGRTLALVRHLKFKIDKRGWPRLRAWSGDDLWIETDGIESDKEFGGLEAGLRRAGAVRMSALTGEKRAPWKGANFSSDGASLWFNSGDKFRVLSLATRRWFDVRLPLRTQYKEGDSWRPNITFSPDGRNVAEQLADGKMRLWDVKARAVTAVLSDDTKYAYPEAMSPVVWSPDGKLVATLGEDPSHFDIVFEQGPNDGTINEHSAVVKIWDAKSGKPLQWFGDVNDPNQLWWRDTTHLAVAGRPNYRGDAAFVVRRVGEAQSWLVESRAPIALHGARLFAGDRLLELGERAQTRVVKILHTAPAALKDVAWSRDGRFLAASYDGVYTGKREESGVQIWNAKGYSMERVEAVNSPMRLAWTADNRVWSSDFYRITSWTGGDNWKRSEWRAPAIEKPMFEGDSPAHGLFLLPDGERIVQLDSGFDNAIYLRANRDAAPELLAKKAQSGGFEEVLSPDGKWLCFRGESRSNSDHWVLRAFETRIGGGYFEIDSPNFEPDSEGNTRWEVTPRFAPDSRFVSWGFRVYEWPSRRLVADTSKIPGDTLALAPGGQTLLRVTPSGVQLFAVGGRALATLTPDASSIRDAQFSPDGTRVAVARVHDIEVYDARTARLLTTLYAWPGSETAPKTEWLATRSGLETRGTPSARALVTKTRAE